MVILNLKRIYDTQKPDSDCFVTACNFNHLGELIYTYQKKSSVYIYLLALTVVTIQAVFLIKGGFIRHWELTEYKEFFIPLGFMFYSIDLLRRAQLRGENL